MSEHLFTPDDISDEFWDALELARRDRGRFRELLKDMNRGELIRFCWDYQEAAVHLRTTTFLKHVDPALSEDGIYEVVMWVVSQGKQYYAEVFNHPEKMPFEVDSHDPSLGIYSEAVSEYRARYGEPIPYRSGRYR